MHFKWIICVLTLSLIFLQGCETVRGAGQGLKKDVHNIAKKDGWVKQTDDWVQEKMW